MGSQSAPIGTPPLCRFLQIHQGDKLNFGGVLIRRLFTNEAALNAAKHVFRPERGSSLEVQLRPKGDVLQLIVQDDGSGPVPAAALAVKRLGMTIMQSLAKQLSGKLETLPGPSLALGVTFSPAQRQ